MGMAIIIHLLKDLLDASILSSPFVILGSKVQNCYNHLATCLRMQYSHIEDH
jgi:hypothetical protein